MWRKNGKFVKPLKSLCKFCVDISIDQTENIFYNKRNGIYKEEKFMKENVFIMEHPLIQHKISMLRDERTGTNDSAVSLKKLQF